MGTSAKASPDGSSKARGRPRKFEYDRALDAALELFWSQGYRTTTTRDLENAVGLSQSSIYNAFGSKRALLESALDRYEAMTDEQLLRPLEQSADGIAAIEAFFVALREWVTRRGRRGCMLINMMAEAGGLDDGVTQRTGAYRDRVRSAFREALRRAVLAGEIDDAGFDERADLLMGLVLGLNIAARGGVPAPELTRLLDAARMQLQSWR